MKFTYYSTFIFLFVSQYCFGQFSQIKEINPSGNSSLALQQGGQARVGDTYFFSAHNEQSGTELWKSDGTENGTVLVKDINSGAGSSEPDHFHVVGNLLLFTADNGINGRELWKSDGTAGGTEMVKEIQPGVASPFKNAFLSLYRSDFQVFNSQLFFRAYDAQEGLELWKSDGTASGTGMVKSIGFGQNDGCQGDFEIMNGVLYFVGFNNQSGDEIWKTDGTDTGTVQVTDNLSDEPRDLTAFGNMLLFTLNDGVNGTELWKSDGTEQGTSLLKDTDVAAMSGGLSHDTPKFEERFFVLGNKAYFSVVNSQNDTQLWLTDGTTAGTKKLKSFGQSDCVPSHFVSLGNQVLFGQCGFPEDLLWISNGTTVGTKMLIGLGQSDLYLDPSFPRFHAHDGNVWFGVKDFGQTNLYKTNGTVANTVQVDGVYAPDKFFSIGNNMIFWATNSDFDENYEPFIYAPTPNATQDIFNNDLLQISPNPAASWIHLNQTGQVSPILQARIIDSNGRIVRVLSELPNNSIHIGDLPNGMYLLQVLSEDRGWGNARFQKNN
jgi:ELWxxDGT repeat protein